MVKANERLPEQTKRPRLYIVKWYDDQMHIRTMTANKLADVAKRGILEYWWLDESGASAAAKPYDELYRLTYSTLAKLRARTREDRILNFGPSIRNLIEEVTKQMQAMPQPTNNEPTFLIQSDESGTAANVLPTFWDVAKAFKWAAEYRDEIGGHLTLYNDQWTIISEDEDGNENETQDLTPGNVAELYCLQNGFTKEIDESPAAGREEDAVEFAEWIREQGIEPTFSNKWVDFSKSNDNRYTSAELYKLFNQQKANS